MLKNLLKDSVVYGISKYLSAFAAIFLMPIYTRELTKEDYGVMDLFNSWNTLMLMIVPLGLVTSIFRFYAEFKTDEKDRRNHLGTVLTSLIILVGIYSFFMFFLQNNFLEITDHPQKKEIFYHSIFLVSGGIINSYFLTVAQSKYEKFKYLAISLTSLTLLISLGFLFVYGLKMGALGFFRASSIALLTALSLSIVLYRKDIYLLFNKPVAKKLLKYSVHILSVGLLFGAANLLDRYLLLHYGDLKDVGIYSVGSRISSILTLGISAFSIAWFPRAMEIKDQKELRDKTYNQVHNIFMPIAFTGLIGLTLMRKEIILIVAPDYLPASNVIVILGLFALVNGFIYFYSLGIHIASKTHFLTYSAIISIIINALVSILLLPMIGIDGVAIGTLVGSIVWVGIQLYVANKLVPIKYNYAFPIIGVIISIIAYYTTELIDNLALNTYLTITLKIGILFLILTAVFFGIKGNKGIKSLLGN